MNYEHTAYPKELCRQVAVKSARYGQPQLPKFGFDKVAFDQPKQLGVVRFLEDDAQFQNGFGAMSHVQVVRDYDFGAGTVVNVKINQ